MKTNITHKILVAVSKEAFKRGYFTFIWNNGEWSLYIRKPGSYIWIDRDTKISVIEDWMKARKGES
ncbi:MAG: hypothetical protein GY820_48325 [Gammaproteobacteria bacterium]|nr:hypothetical protein [Gammaproteobacteria bacterium]